MLKPELNDAKAFIRSIVRERQPISPTEVIHAAPRAKSQLIKRAIWYMMDDGDIIWGRDRLLTLP